MIMKKILLTLACVFGMSMTALALSTTTVLLQHNGNITTYDADKISDAMEAAVDGDVIILNEGTYPAFNITKKVTVKGCGEKTIINGNVDINIPNEPNLTANLMEYLTLQGGVTVKSAIRGMKIKQCKLPYSYPFKIEAFISDSSIDRCEIKQLIVSGTNNDNPYVKGLTVSNSIISVSGINITTLTQQTTFINCYIKGCEWNLGNVINSIVLSSGGNKLYNTTFVNSYIKNNLKTGSVFIDEVSCTMTDCYFGEEAIEYDSEDIVTNGYLGQDGTIIGPLGGATPFTLEPTVPHVTNASLKVDPMKQELNATLTVSPK